MTVNGCETSIDWLSKHISVQLGERKGWACHLEAWAILPLSAAQAYELLTHPDNAAIFKGIDRCSYRHILHDDGCGRLMVEVENVSDWRFLLFKGSIATRLLVRQDYHAGTMHIQLAPDTLGTGPRTPGCKQVPLELLEAQWAVKPLSECLDQATALLPHIPQEARDRMDELYCCVRLEQSLSPWGIPGFLYGAFKGFAKGQVQQTFEDVLAEAQRIRRGFPSLCPYEEVCMKEVRPEDHLSPAPQLQQQESPLKQERDQVEEGSTVSGGPPAAGRHGAGERVLPPGGGKAPRSFAQRRPSLRGHRLADWDIWEAEMDMDREWEESELGGAGSASAAGSCTPLGSCTPMQLGDDASCAASWSDAGSDAGHGAANALAAALAAAVQSR